MNLTTKQKQRHHLIQGIQLVEKIEASEILETRTIMLHQPLHRNTNHYTVSLHKQKVLIERSCYLLKIRTKL